MITCDLRAPKGKRELNKFLDTPDRLLKRRFYIIPDAQVLYYTLKADATSDGASVLDWHSEDIYFCPLCGQDLRKAGLK